MSLVWTFSEYSHFTSMSTLSSSPPGVQHPAAAVGGVRGTLHHQLHPLQLARHPRQPRVRGPRGHRTGQ